MTRPLLGAGLLIALGLLLGAGQAAAAGQPAGTPDARDLSAVAALATSPSTVDQLAKVTFPDSPKVAARMANAAKAEPAASIAVYQPTAAFVAGTSAVPADLAYVAVPATLGTGEAATVWAQREGQNWTVVNIASGDVEKRLATQAGKGYLLHEPQINAWYAVDGDAVTVLDGSTTGVASGTRMTVAQYQSAVHARYGDKLPGSAYDRSGAAGGFGPAAPASDDTGVPGWSIAAGAGALVLAAGVALRLRRRTEA
ncbi:hypothetical protein [Amycolatopsis sp. NPDC059657]|uniref:hypothetical protein n=1 Tax=Amycolatopsis sp. NPDC059657 TaxID=3346899 RepID=UPI00366FD087